MDKYIFDHKAPMTLLAFLGAKYPEMSRKALKRAIEQGCCIVNGKVETFSTHPLRAKDQISFRKPAVKETPQQIPILYQDEEIVVVDKPIGIICHETTLQQLLPLQESFLVHRLDKETSGVWLIAKTPQAYQKLRELFATRQVEKRYLAKVLGRLEPKEGCVTDYLGVKESYQGQKKYGAVKATQGKLAITHYKEIAYKNPHSLVELIPETGRTHQLRVHMKSLKHPILGDLLYGVEWGEKIYAPRLMLHAQRLSFTDPESGKRYEFTSKEPSEFIL